MPCRVCYGETSEANPLLSPCDCRGSVEFIHLRCLYTWIHLSNKKRCELCLVQYSLQDLALDTVVTPPPYILCLSTKTHLMFLSWMFLYLGYLFTTNNADLGFLQPVCPAHPLTWGNVWLSVNRAIPAVLMFFAMLQLVVLGPAFARIGDKRLYLRYLVSSRMCHTFPLSPGFTMALVVKGFLTLRGPVPFLGTILLLMILPQLYKLHCSMIRQMNTDRLSQYVMADVVEAARIENRIAAQRATAEAVAVADAADAAEGEADEGEADEEIEAEEIEERVADDLPLVVNA